MVKAVAEKMGNTHEQMGNFSKKEETIRSNERERDF